jgi:pectinesterase
MKTCGERLRAAIGRFVIGLVPAFLTASAGHAEPVSIVLVGDSTVTDDAGWGEGFRRFVTDDVRLTNTARGGRSSKSFIQEGAWEKSLALKGDYYLIQFGHNDEPGKPGRSTTVEEYRTFMNRYVDDVRAAGATPVLVTSLVRRQFKDRDDPHRIESSLTERAEIVRDVARTKDVPLVELHERSKELCEKLGRDGCLVFSPRKKDGSYDGTHLNPAGHEMFGRIVAAELRAAVPELAAHLREAPVDPASGRAESFDAVVAVDGSGTHATVQAAVDAAPGDATAAKPFRIRVKPGVYKEHVAVAADRPFIQLLGEPGRADGTVITMGTNVNSPVPGQGTGKKMSTPDSATVLVQASDFTAEHITFENTTTREDRVQALAFFVSGDRAVLRNCRFLGWQDTLRCDAPKGQIARQYFVDCEITGHVDFIYSGGTAVFDRCRIHCRADGYITAASTPETTPFGFVFLDCTVTTAAEVQQGMYFGRPWRPHAATAFIRCNLQGIIRPEGWDNWGKEDNEKTARYAEYGSTGPGGDVAKRVPWARQLNAAEAAAYTVEKVLGGADGWSPTTAAAP